MAESKTTFVGGHVPSEDAKSLREIAEANDRSVAAELRIAIREHVEPEATTSTSRAKAAA